MLDLRKFVLFNEIIIIKHSNKSFLLANSALKMNFLSQYLSFDEKIGVDIVEGAFLMNKENKNVCKVTTKISKNF